MNKTYFDICVLPKSALALSVKREFDVESGKVQFQDYTRYLWVCKFALEFYRKEQVVSILGN